jgi:transcriptional regulator with XRE-family HTH domain
MERGQSFGEFLRACRLRAGYGLRSFAEAIDMQPSNLSNIEHGRANPPQDREVLTRVADTLGLRGSERHQFFDLAVKHKPGALPADVADYVGKNPGIPVLLRTIAGRRLTRKDLDALVDHVKEQGRKAAR